MASEYISASSFSLTWGTLGGEIAVKSFSGLKMDVEVSSHSIGNTQGGKKKLEPQPGPTKPGQPTFICSIPKGDKKLADWWKNSNPNTEQGVYNPQDLTFTFAGPEGAAAAWQLKGAFPISYQVSDAETNSSDIASETIQLCVTEIVRMM